jgi:ABC-type lipoprotein export system ATPase subunit
MSEIREPILRAERLHRTYRLPGVAVEALRGVDLEIYAGEFVAIMGPSGSGKSTLLNLLGGLDDPTGGVVYLAGQPISALPEEERARLRRQQFGFVFQSYDLLALLSARQNVEFPLAVAGVAAAVRRARATDLLAQLGLADKADAMPDELSGGQKQRVALARALANRPRVILADEPTGSLDSLMAGEVIALLRQVVSDYATSVVMVTHDAGDAGQADRIIRLRDGRLDTEVREC